MSKVSPPSVGRRPLLVAKVGVASIVYTVLASPIACNLPAPSPAPPRDAQDAQPAGSSSATPKD